MASMLRNAANGLRTAILGVALAAGTFVATAANAAITLGPSIGGYETFTDDTTGYHWLRLDTFMSKTPNQMFAAAQAAGFTVANIGEVQTLLGTLPLAGGAWSDYAAIMGRAPNREIIFGTFGPAVGGYVGRAYAYSNDASWSSGDGYYGENSVVNQHAPAIQDLNLFAYVTAVPEPATWAMMIAGFGGVGLVLRRRRSDMASGPACA
jgi:hypothetical protein